ncbi:bacterial transduction protein [compost metagenome]
MPTFGRTEKTIFFGAVIVLMVFSYFLYDDSLLFPREQNSQLELIGAVYNSQNDVRRKNVDTFSWLPADNKDKVFQNDSIFTGDRSEAAIQLQDGSLIHIRPNSLITLNVKNGQMSLDLRYGDLVGELAQGSSLTVKSGAEEFKLENDPSTQEKSKIEFKKSHSGNVDLKLLSGQAALNKKAITKGAALNISKTGQVQTVQKPVVTLNTEAPHDFLRINPDDPLPFDWKSTGDVSRFELETSADEKFSSIATSQYSNETKASVIDPLQTGEYFWRVKAYDKNGEVAVVTPPAKFSVSQLQAPQIINPEIQAELNLEVAQPKTGPLLTSAQIQWKAMRQLQSFTWQLATDAEFTNVVKEDTTTALEAATPPLESGAYWVRVRGTTQGQNVSAWSEPVPFALSLTVQKGTERPTAPILVSKSVTFKSPAPNDRNPATAQAPTLQWKPVNKSATYILQIAKDMTFENSARYELKSVKADWSQYRPGKFFFRVYAKNPNGLISEASEVGVLDITASSPQLHSFDVVRGVGATATPREVPISWTEIPFAKSYLVQMDKSEDFSSPTQLEYTSTSGKITVPEPGKYRVRVQALDEDNKPVTDFSNIEEVLYSFRSPLGSPTLAEPFNNASIFLQKEMEPFIWLEWKKVKGATSYKVEVSDRSDFSRILISKTLPGNRFLIKERVPLGKIFWRVRAESKDDQESSDWASQREFTIYHQKNEIFVK